MLRNFCVLLMTLSPMSWAATVDDYLSAPAASSIQTTEDSGLNSDFLPADQAFTFSAETKGTGSVNLKFVPQPGYYFYRSKFAFESLDPSVTIGDVTYPKGITKDDPTYGTTEVYEDPSVVILSPSAKAAATSQKFKLSVTYQGCAEAGLCYPSETKIVEIQMPRPLAPKVERAEPSLPIANEAKPNPGKREDALGLYGYLLFFLSGIALAFTPCVLPMLPIMSSVVLGDARSKWRCFVLSSGYVVGMATCFTFLGALMGVFGAKFNIQARLQSPWVLVPFGVAFIGLGFAMQKSINLELPAFITDRLRRISSTAKNGSLGGATLMGVISGLITSPCVSAPLAGALLYIGQSGDVFGGAISLMALGLGMGTPLIAFAVGGGWLIPKAGRWMETVKNGFSLMLACLGIWIMGRVLPDSSMTILWAVLIGIIGYRLGALELRGKGGITRAKQLIGFVLLVCAVVTVFECAKSQWSEYPNGNAITQNERAGSWMTTDDFSVVKKALASSATSGKPAVLDWYADWCVSCKIFERDVLQRSDVKDLLKHFTLIKFDLTQTTQAQRDALNEYKLFGPPVVMLFDGKANEVTGLRVIGDVNASDFKARLQKILPQL